MRIRLKEFISIFLLWMPKLHTHTERPLSAKSMNYIFQVQVQQHVPLQNAISFWLILFHSLIYIHARTRTQTNTYCRHLRFETRVNCIAKMLFVFVRLDTWKCGIKISIQHSYDFPNQQVNKILLFTQLTHGATRWSNSFSAIKFLPVSPLIR